MLFINMVVFNDIGGNFRPFLTNC